MATLLRRFAPRLTYFLITAVIVLLIVEGAVRLLHVAPALPDNIGVSDPYLPYKPKPLGIAYRNNEEFKCEYKHNSLGFRDVEHSILKPEGTFRILGLGDSFTYGVGVSFEETFLSQLEAKLNNRQGKHPRVEIIKAGIPRYFPEAERILLDHYGRNFSPDLILVAFLPNDVLDTHLGIDAVKVHESGYLVPRDVSPHLTSLYIHSHVFRILYKGLQGKASWQKFEEDVYKPNGFFEKDWLTVELEYAKMLQLTESIGARAVIIHIPQSSFLRESASYPALRLSQWCRNNGTVFVDTLPALSAASKTLSLYYAKDGHARSEGHAVIAQALFTELTEKNVVP